MSFNVSLKELLEAGCHFGHQAQRWHPKAAPYIYTERDGIHIIDLAKTKEGLLAACEYLRKIVSEGGTVVFLGTKRQAKDIVRAEAERSGAFFVSERWPAGLLTNFEVMKKNLEHLKELREKMVSEETKATYTKREIGLFEKELAKLELLYGGIADLTDLPTVIYVVDVRKEAGAVKEAEKKGVTVVGIVDTNCDPALINYPIPGNDDAVGSIKIITKYIADVVGEGMKAREKKEAEEKIKNHPSASLGVKKSKTKEGEKEIEKPKDMTARVSTEQKGEKQGTKFTKKKTYKKK